MDKQKKEALMDGLLVFMNEEIERAGSPIHGFRFDFGEQGKDTINFVKDSGSVYEELVLVLNACISQNYVATYVMDGKGEIGLTEKGQKRAISVEDAKSAPPKQESTGINITALYANAPFQIGNGNTQNIEILFSTIIEKINQADASDEEKKDAKSRLKAFLEHPLTNTALGLTPSFIQSILGVA